MKKSQQKIYTHNALSVHTGLWAVLVMTILLTTYVVLRYRGLWGEIDTSNFTLAIRAIVDTGQLIPSSERYVYANGYSYQTLVVMLMSVTGLSLPIIQTIVAPLLMIWVVLPAWLLYREFTGSERGATLATAILLVQPEFLFPLLRGTHEKFTRGLMLICLYLLVRSLRANNRPVSMFAFVISFYLCGYALITFNNLIATSFILAIGLGLLLQFMINHERNNQINKAIERLSYVTGALIIIAFIFTFYTYKPAQQNLLIFQSIWDRLAALLLDVENSATNPYRVVNTLWRDIWIYFLVSIANWLLLASSATIWLSQSWSWLRGRIRPQQTHEMLLWAFYGAFAFQGALSIAVDISGALSSNLQYRLFPSFAMLGAPLVAVWLIKKSQHSRLRRAAGIILTITISLLSILSVSKAISEPLLSNKWTFYRPSEMTAIYWSTHTLANRSLWLGYDERLTTAYAIATSATRPSLVFDHYDVEDETKNVLISPINRQLSLRLSTELPIESTSIRTYDNGEVQIYHRRPRTPYQK